MKKKRNVHDLVVVVVVDVEELSSHPISCTFESCLNRYLIIRIRWNSERP